MISTLTKSERSVEFYIFRFLGLWVSEVVTNIFKSFITISTLNKLFNKALFIFQTQHVLNDEIPVACLQEVNSVRTTTM